MLNVATHITVLTQKKNFVNCIAYSVYFGIIYVGAKKISKKCDIQSISSP